MHSFDWDNVAYSPHDLYDDVHAMVEGACSPEEEDLAQVLLKDIGRFLELDEDQWTKSEFEELNDRYSDLLGVLND